MRRPAPVTANDAIIPEGANDVFATEDTDLVIDVNGYFSAAGLPGGLSYFAVSPCRAVDTRLPSGPLGGPSLTGQRDFNLSSSVCGIPANALAVSLNATVVPQGPLVFLKLWAAGQSLPLASTLNSLYGSIVSSGALVPAARGAISAYATQTTDLILDVNGYFR